MNVKFLLKSSLNWFTLVIQQRNSVNVVASFLTHCIIVNTLFKTNTFYAVIVCLTWSWTGLQNKNIYWMILFLQFLPCKRFFSIVGSHVYLRYKSLTSDLFIEFKIYTSCKPLFLFFWTKGVEQMKQRGFICFWGQSYRISVSSLKFEV